MKKQFINGNFIYYDDNNFKLFTGNMLIEDNKVLEFSNNLYDNIETIDLNNKIVIPSFINAHIHLGETLYAPLPCKMTITEYLNYTEKINKQLKSQMDDYWQTSAEITLKQSLESGVCAINTIRGNNYNSEVLLKTISGYPIMDSYKLRGYYLKGIENYKAYCEDCYSKNMIPCVFIHSFYSTNEDCLEFARNCMKYTDALCTIHGYEDEGSENLVRQKWNKSTVELLKENGWLNNKTILVHGCTLSDEEIKEIAENHVNLVICPISNINLKTKYPNPEKLIKNKINWCIGSDGLASGESADLLKQCELLIKDNIDCIEILKALTINPQSALRLNNEILSINSKVNFVTFENFKFKNLEDILTNIFSNKLQRKDVYFNNILIKGEN